MKPGYTVVTEKDVNGKLQYTAKGPGLGHAKPLFEEEWAANRFCACLEQAFEAGEQSRSRELMKLLNDGTHWR